MYGLYYNHAISTQNVDNFFMDSTGVESLEDGERERTNRVSSRQRQYEFCQHF